MKHIEPQVETEPPKYAIVNEVDRPCMRLVTQWVPNVGYCYMAQSIFPELKQYNGMAPYSATAMEDFGFEAIEASNGVCFRKTGPSRAHYKNGEPRDWQDYEHNNDCFILPYVEIKERE